MRIRRYDLVDNYSEKFIFSVGEAEGDLSPSPEQSDNAMSRTKEVVLVIKLQTPIYS